MLSDYELQQQALKQKLARQQAQDQINQLEAKLQQIIQIQKEIEEQDFQYQQKCDDLQKKREQQMIEIKNLREKQENDLKRQSILKPRTKAQYDEMWKHALIFQQKQQHFIYQQKLDKDQLKSFQVTQAAKQSLYEIDKQLVVPQNPFVLLSQAQGFLDSQYDQFYQSNIQKMEQIVKTESQCSKSKIQFTFVSFKPDMPTLEQFEKRKYEGTVNQIPLSLFLMIDFYDFPSQKTGNLIYEDCPTIDDVRRIIGYDQELKLAYEEYYTNKAYAKKACFSFEVENDYKLIYYLLFKNAYIRVFDAITGENYGYCQIPLNSLIRENKSDTYSILEVQVLSYDWTITYGIFTLTVQNIGLENLGLTKFGQTILSQTQIMGQTSQTIFFNQAMDNKSKIQTSFINASTIGPNSTIKQEDRLKLRISQVKPQSAISQARKKITSMEPKNLKEYAHSTIINSKISDVETKLRLNERIRSKHSDILGYLSTRDTFSKLQAVELSRKWDRDLFLSKILPSHMTSMEIELPAGEKVVQLIEYTNTSDSDQLITVEIAPYIATLAAGDELDKIYEMKEVPFHARVEAEDNVFKCHAQQRSVICIVFYTTTEIDKEVEVAVYLKYKQQPICGQLYKLIPKSQVIDMQFDFYRQPNHQEVILLPPLFCFCEIKYRANPVIVCSRQEISFGINSDDMRIKLELKTPDIGKQLILLLFFYRDRFYHQLLLTAAIKITSLTLLQLSTTMGQATECSLEFKTDRRRNIYFHSLNQDKVWFETPYDKPLWIEKTATIPFFAYQMTSNSYIVKVNAIDQTTNELVYSWLLQISANMPKIKRVFTYDCNFRQSYPFKAVYQNTSGKTLYINVTSSSYLLKTIQSQYKLPVNGKAELDLIFMKAEEYYAQDIAVVEKQREILLFIYDIKNKVFDTYLFQFDLYDQSNDQVKKPLNLQISK